MTGFELSERRLSRRSPAGSDILRSLTDALKLVSLSRNIQKPLVRCGILHDRLGLTIQIQ